LPEAFEPDLLILKSSFHVMSFKQRPLRWHYEISLLILPLQGRPWLETSHSRKHIPWPRYGGGLYPQTQCCRTQEYTLRTTYRWRASVFFERDTGSRMSTHLSPSKISLCFLGSIPTWASRATITW
jgi:hypothetical protein